jgi:hypothetical protein
MAVRRTRLHGFAEWVRRAHFLFVEWRRGKEGGPMTEAEWLTCENPDLLEDFLTHVQRNERKLRLYACACCRRAWHLFADQRCQAAVAVAERFSDGLVDYDELATASDSAFDAMKELGNEDIGAWAATCVTCHDLDYILFGDMINDSAERLALLGDVFGNPFRPVSCDSGWRTPAILAMAHTAYESDDFSFLSALADALEDAGCTDRAILDHLRGSGPHVRGCWAIDLILGKQ